MREFSILHVDDDDAAALLMRVALQEISPHVHYDRLGDVDKALHLLAASVEQPGLSLPQLILLDLNLPRKSGFEMFRAIRESPPLAHICVVVFTSSVASGDRNRALALGASSYVIKPAAFEDFLAVLRDAIKLAEHAELTS